jgi:arginyl-tRNA synthetase
VQYAHARICSVFAQWGGNKAALIEADFSPLKEHHEFDLCRKLEDYSERIELAASEYAPHHIAHYLQALAASLHSYYNAHQFLVADEKLKIARLALIEAVRYVLADGLKLLGVNAPEKM